MKRFYYTGPGKVMHRVYSKLHVEGELAKCGLRIGPGWKWFQDKRGATVCKNCERAA